MYLRKLFSVWLFVVGVCAVGGCAGDSVERQAPIVTVDVRAEETYTVGEDIIQIHITAQDPQGSKLSFTMVDQPPRSQLQTFQNSAVFTWDPISSDVTEDEPRRLIFVVKNDYNMTTERVVSVRIRAGNGLPRFLNSTSEMYDPTSNAPLNINVRVRADDLSKVDLSMKSAPEGASFEQIGNFEGTFQWLPDSEQQKRRMHSVVFVASDPGGQFPPVEHQVTIIVRQKTSGSVGGTPGSDDMCFGESIIEHTPLSAQRGLQNYTIEATLNSAAPRLYSHLYVYWTTEDAFNLYDSYFESLEMSLDNGVYKATIPNPGLQPWETQTIYYSICAVDETAEDGDDLAIVCTPSSIYYSFIAYSPDQAACLSEIGNSIDSQSRANPMNAEDWGVYQLCAQSPHFHHLEVSPGELAEIFVVYSDNQDIKIEVYDGAEDPIDFERSNCAGYSQIIIDNVDGSASEDIYVKVRGDDIVYQISAFVEGDVIAPGENNHTSQCEDASLEPNDTPENATWINQANDSIQGAICSSDDIDIYTFQMLLGDVLDAKLYFSHTEGDLDLTLFSPTQESQVLNSGSSGVASSWSSSDDEEIYYSAQESGFYFLKVYSYDDPAEYTLTLALACEDQDQFAGNHVQSTAAYTQLSTAYNDLKLCPYKTDWYEIDVTAGDTIWAEIFIEEGGVAGDVIVEGIAPNGTTIGYGESRVSGMGIDLEFTAAQSGTHYFQVWSDRSIVYRLETISF